MGVYSTECGVGLGIIRFFSMNSGQDKNFWKKCIFWVIFCIFKGVFGENGPGPRQDKNSPGKT